MRGIFSITIIIFLLMFVTSCAISPMRTKDDEKSSKSTPGMSEKGVEAGRNDPKSSKEVVTLNVLVPEASLLKVATKRAKSMIPENIDLHFIPMKQALYVEEEELVPKLLAHSKEIDIFYIRSNQEFSRSVIEKGIMWIYCKTKNYPHCLMKCIPRLRNGACMGGQPSDSHPL